MQVFGPAEHHCVLTNDFSTHDRAALRGQPRKHGPSVPRCSSKFDMGNGADTSNAWPCVGSGYEIEAPDRQVDQLIE